MGTRSLQYLGRNDLIIICIHEPIKRIVPQIMKIIRGDEMDILRQDNTFCIIALIMIVLVCIPFVHLINKYLPWMVGKIQYIYIFANLQIVTDLFNSC